MCGEQSKKPSATDKGIFRRVKICEYMLFYIYSERYPGTILFPGYVITFCYIVSYHNATLPMLPISSLALIPIALKTLAMVEKVKFLPFSIREI